MTSNYLMTIRTCHWRPSLKNILPAITMASPDDLIVRLSGDEFVVVYNFDKLKPNIDDYAEKILSKMNEPIIIHGREIVIHCSIGISIFPNHGNDMETLIKKADIAMYESKRYGKNQYYIFEDDMERIFNIKFEEAYELRKAIKNKDFVVHYQKIADIKRVKQRLRHWSVGNIPKKGFFHHDDLFLSLRKYK